jgi:hypothetical protein
VKRFVLLAAAILVLLGVGEAWACRDHVKRSRMAIGPHVERLGLIEDEVLHRLAGNTMPPFDELTRTVRTIAGLMLPPTAAIAEQRSRRCRNWVPPVRRTCRDAALRLLEVIAESAAGAVSYETRAEYSHLIARCETWLLVPPRSSLLRTP